MRLFDLAFGRLDRAGERALFMPEQFTFEQSFGDRRTVDGDECALAAVASFVQPAREQLLAGPACAEQHDRHICVRDALDGPRDLEHFGRCRNHAAEHGIARDRFGQSPVFRLDPVQMKRTANNQAQFVNIDRLGVKIIGAARNRPQR